MKQDKATQFLKIALADTERHLNEVFDRARIWTEADIQTHTVSNLYRLLSQCPGEWIINSCKTVDIFKPDIAVYWLPGYHHLSRFLRSSNSGQMNFIVGIIEIKWFAGLKAIGLDLAKLRNLQRKIKRVHGKSIITWIVFGDHFSNDIHPGNYQSQLGREKKISDWVSEAPSNRGMSILKFGNLKGLSSKSNSVRSAFNRHFWAHPE